MKNRKKAIIAIILTAALLVACGTRTDKNVTSGEMVAPEVSSQDLLVSSLEYLLLNNEDASQQEEQDSSEQKEQDLPEQETTAQDDQSAVEESEVTPEKQPAQAEDEVQGEEAVIYYGDGGSVALKQEAIEVAAVSPDELIGALARHNIVSLDTKVLSFEQEEEESGDVVLRLDLSKAAGEYLRTMSKEAECIIVAAIVDTFLENYDAVKIYITVDGDTLVTSNAEYTDPIEQCTPEELIKVLEASVADESADNMQNKPYLTV